MDGRWESVTGSLPLQLGNKDTESSLDDGFENDGHDLGLTKLSRTKYEAAA